MRYSLPLLLAAALAAQTAPKLSITGDLPAPLEMSLAGLPRETATLLDEKTNQRVPYEGVPIDEFLKKAGMPLGQDLRGKGLAIYLLAEAKDGYQVVFSLGELDSSLSGARVIVADRREGKPLAEYEGPLRLVIDGDKRPSRSVRMLEKLEVVRLRK
jgi:hypothetical protein